MKTKSFYWILLVLCLVSNVKAQNTFFKWYTSPFHQFIYSSIELSDNHYILCGLQADDAFSKERGYMAKLNSNGELITEYQSQLRDTASFFACAYKIPGVVNRFNLLGSKSIVQNGNTIQLLAFTEFDDNLQLTNSRNFRSPINHNTLPQAVQVMNDSIVFTQSLVNSTLQPYNTIGIQIGKFNHLFDSITSLFIPIPNAFCAGIITDTVKQRIRSFNRHNINVYSTEYDTDLNQISENALPFFVSSICGTRLNNEKYLLTGVWSDGTVPKSIKVRKFDNNDNLLDSVLYYRHPDTILYSGAVMNTCMVENTIFVVGIHNIIPSQYPWQQSPSWLQITRLDTSLNIHDHHFYGGDAFYMPYKIFKTSDGGVFVAGSRYDFHNPELVYHPFALKVNSEGLITDLPDDSPYKAHDAIVYPNPGSEVVIVQSGPQIQGAVFTLFDMQGKAILSQTLHSTEQHFDTKNLPSGTYPWHITFKNKIIENGKWIKR